LLLVAQRLEQLAVGDLVADDLLGDLLASVLIAQSVDRLDADALARILVDIHEDGARSARFDLAQLIVAADDAELDGMRLDRLREAAVAEDVSEFHGFALTFD
jgi:hypothetical protein